MQYTGMTEMFGVIGELFNKGFKPIANKFEHKVTHSGDNIVHFWTKSNRPLKILGFMTGSFCIVSGSMVIHRKLQLNESIIPEIKPLAGTYFQNEYNTTILPRLQQAIDTAFKYAQNGNISLLDPHLDTIAEIVIEYPQFKKFVKYNKPLEFPINTYFNGKNNQLITQNEPIENTENESDSKPILLQSQTQSSDTATMILSMNEKELKNALLENTNLKNDMIKFENQLDYIRHLCVIKRCEKIYFRAIRYAQKGNVEKCAGLLAELWEHVCKYDVGAIIIANKDDKKYKLEEDDLLSVMKLCHRNYVQYLINSAKQIGDKVDRKGMKNDMIVDANRKLLTMVWKNLENARLYAEKYNVFEQDVKNELKNVWKQKETELKIN
eukprot:267185_1